jgi:hypothetical protein
LPYTNLRFSSHVHLVSFRYLTFELLCKHSRLVVQWPSLTFDYSKDHEGQPRHLRLSICILLQSPLIHDEPHDQWSSSQMRCKSQPLGQDSLDFHNFLSVYHFIRRFKLNQKSFCWRFKVELWGVILRLVLKPISSLKQIILFCL